MSVQIVINGENANEAIQELAALSAGISGRNETAEPTPTAPKKAERAAKTTRSKPESAKTLPTAAPESEDEPVNDESETDDSGASDEPIPTDVELRELARNIGAKGPEAKAAIKELLKKYGVPNITAVPAEKRLAFKRELEALA